MSFDPETGEVEEGAAMPSPASQPKMPPAVAGAIIAVMRSVRQLGYDDTNKHAGYKFVSIDKFLDAMRPVMAGAGLILMLEEDKAHIFDTTRDDGKVTSWLRVAYSITLFHESGESYGPLHRQCIVPAVGAQAFASAQSFLMKYFMRALFMIPTGDKDGEVDAHEAKDLPKHAPTQNGAQRQQAASDNGQAAQGESERDRAQRLYNEISKEIMESLDHAMLEDIQTRRADDLEAIRMFSTTSHAKLIERGRKQRELITNGPAKSGAPKI